jgi:hypothetical protein
VVARNSLLDFVQFNSWIKKSNYEGIFNAMLVVFLFLLVHKPIVSEAILDFSCTRNVCKIILFNSLNDDTIGKLD